ncbi:MAG TPA: 2-C-methyl-D-erythritol 4-phosphate cytidylyltransferase [Vicinamibacterales bacterium]|nr:2-C-methyl-D-erythritol 4-phosphate cytidylyltransferase [Vicinamibacterales bacterium]
MFVSVIVAAGGSGTRLGAGAPKQLLDIGGRSMLARTVGTFDAHPRVSEIVVVLPSASLGATIPSTKPVHIVAGGRRRQDSVANGFAKVSREAEVVLVHDAARPFVSAALIDRAIDAAAIHGAVIPALDVKDTVKRVKPDRADRADRLIVETLPRESIVLAQTPQAFRRQVLADAIAAGRPDIDATDEAMLAERAGHPVYVVGGDPQNVKITTQDDLDLARRQSAPARTGRAGTGYDLHLLVAGRPLILGGVTVPSPKGAIGHSDADVVCHSVIDAVLGALGLGDIGRHFPDTDPEWKGASSIDLLKRAITLVRDAGYAVGNVDVTVILEKPKIKDHIEAMRANIAAALGVDASRVSVKGKTNEGVDAVGRGEAIAAHAVALVRKL